MTDDPRLARLVKEWHEARQRGAPVDVDELCRDCPELAPALRDRIAPVTQVPRETTTGPAAARLSDPAALGEISGFRLVRVLGEGGMGIVYEAEDLGLHRRVALKVLRPDRADESFRKRFEREARAVAGLRHDNIVTVYQVGRQGEAPFLVMEYLEGETLETRLHRQGWLSVPEALAIARGMAEGLASAHAKGLIHRDIKPANVWLEKPHDRVKLLDFGLARPVDCQTELTAHGAIVGTPGYMAPEQIYAGQLDARTDLYALGCVLFRMLSGQMPHEAPDTMQLLEAVVTQDVPSLDGDRQVPPRVRELLRPLLERDAAKRPASAEAVAANLRLLERGSVALPHALPPSITTGARRQRVPAGVWAGGLTILLAALIGILGLWARLAPERDEGKAGVPVAAGEPIRVGILHSKTGTFAGSERPMIDALLLAVDEIRRGGGVLGRPLQVVIADGKSDAHEFGRQAERFLADEKVSAIFGCWSSSARKKTDEACVRHNSLLIHASLSEGLDPSQHTINVGGAPNQQLEPAVKYAYTDLHRRRFFLVGSDYLYSRAHNQILRDLIEKLGAMVVGDEYVPLEASDFSAAISKIKGSKADIILSTVDGSSNIDLFKSLRGAGIRGPEVPTFWLSIGVEDLGSLRLKNMVGDYMSAPYFQTLSGTTNDEFVKRFVAQFPARTHIDDEMEASYCALHMWKQAVEKARTPEPMRVRDAFRGLSYNAPEGPIRIDPENLCAWRMARVGRFSSDLEFRVVYTSAEPVEPVPFPVSRTRGQWDAFVQQLYKEWGGHWEAGHAPARP